MGTCPLGVNGGEFPHWPVSAICELAVKLGAAFVELSSQRLQREGVDAVGREVHDRGLGLHVGAMVSGLPAAFDVAGTAGAPFIVAVDDAIERPDVSRGESLAAFRRLATGLLERPAHAAIRLAIENSVIKVTRQPEDVLAVVELVGHPRFGVNFDPGNFYNAGIEPFPYAYELLGPHIAHLHVKDSGRYVPALHGDTRRVLHRAGGNVVCLPVGTGAVNWAGLIERLKRDGYAGPVSLEPHLLPEEMAPAMAADAAYLRRAGLVR